MKKLLLSVFTLVAVAGSVAQTFFDNTTYRGAFAPSPAPMWTDTWTEWDPQNKTYPAPTTTITGTITTSQNWNAGTTVLLQGPVYVKNNAVINIQPGVVILGSKVVSGSALIICKGSQLVANGTAASPIVFTSDQAPGARSIGDWGGIVMLGNAALNYTNGINNVEGLPVAPETEFGGGASPNNNDNSGSLKYVRIEFGGYVYQPNKEINGLTMGAVGKATTLEHIQVSFTNDDGFEWFGGNVSGKWLVSYRNLDDDFDTDNGWSGNVQYGLIVRDPNLADNPAVSTSEGFESDNDANGTTATPITSGIFSNITMVGPYRGATTNTIATGYRRALRLRRSTNLKIYNSIFMDTQRGIHIDGTNCEIAAGNGNIKFKNNIIAGMSQKAVEQNTANTFATNAGMTTVSWFTGNANDSINGSSASFSVILTTPYNYTSPDYRPTGTSIALGTASFTDPVIAPLTSSASGYAEIERSIGYIMLYPNPASGITHLLINSNIDTKSTILVTDIAGKVIQQIIKDKELSIGLNELQINTVGMSNGIYFVTLNTGIGKETVKLIVNN